MEFLFIYLGDVLFS
jgi:hypothetical protein